jgi:general secretion pathway protein B
VAGLAPLPEAGYQAARPDPRRTDDLGVGPRTLAEPATPGDATTGLAENASGQDAMDEPISDDWMEMDEELGPAQPAELSPADETAAPRHRRTKPARAALPDPAVPSIPEDLRRDVAAFKDEIRRERSGAAPRPAAAKATREDPKKLRLPLEVEGRLPAFFVTAHIYDTDSSKRFVVLNSLKYTEGETTREGLKVEDILPDGVVLGFEGHRFFRRR